MTSIIEGLPVASLIKSLPANARQTKYAVSISGWERCPGEGNGNPLQYSCLENPMDRGAWQATVRGPVNLVTKTTTRDDLKNIGGGTSLVVQWVIF